MQFNIKQKSKELFVAEFDIIENEKNIGKISVKGKLNSFNPTVLIEFKDKKISMEPKLKWINGKSRFYKIMSNNNEYGAIYEKKHKIGFLTWKYIPTLEINGTEYEMGSVGVGESDLEGLVKTDKGYNLTIYNEMYNYNIKCKDDVDEALRTIILTIYKYGIVYFKSGQKMTNSVRKVYLSTRY